MVGRRSPGGPVAPWHLLTSPMSKARIRESRRAGQRQLRAGVVKPPALHTSSSRWLAARSPSTEPSPTMPMTATSMTAWAAAIRAPAQIALLDAAGGGEPAKAEDLLPAGEPDQPAEAPALLPLAGQQPQALAPRRPVLVLLDVGPQGRPEGLPPALGVRALAADQGLVDQVDLRPSPPGRRPVACLLGHGDQPQRPVRLGRRPARARRPAGRAGRARRSPPPATATASA